jgi:hypothetical protein
MKTIPFCGPALPFIADMDRFHLFYNFHIKGIKGEEEKYLNAETVFLVFNPKIIYGKEFKCIP